MPSFWHGIMRPRTNGVSREGGRGCPNLDQRKEGCVNLVPSERGGGQMASIAEFKRSYLNDVCKIFGIFNPLPLVSILARFIANLDNLPFYVSYCIRHLSMAPKTEKQHIYRFIYSSAIHKV